MIGKQAHFNSCVYHLGLSRKNLFRYDGHRVSGLTHGDHFMVAGPTNRFANLRNKIAGVSPTKVISYGSEESFKALNRRLHWRKRGVVCQHDPRHVDVFVEDLGLEHADLVQTPAVLDVTDEEPEPLDQMQSGKYRSQVARYLFLSQDRADMTFFVNGLCQRNVKPHASEPCQVAKASQYWKREEAVGTDLQLWKMSEQVMTYSYSDWAMCKGTRKSSSAGVMLIGDHMLTAYSRKQHAISKSNAESTLYVAALAASGSKGIVSLMFGLGYVMKPVLAIEANTIFPADKELVV